MNLQKVQNFFKKNSNTILTGVACAGVLGTAYFAATDAIEAQEQIRQMDVEGIDDKKERLRRILPCYIPTALITATTISAIVCNHNINSERVAAYSSAYALAQSAARQYKDKVLEVVGEKKAKEIDQKVDEEKLRQHPKSNEVTLVGNGTVLCFDNLTSRYFKSEPEYLRKTVNDMNFEMMANDWVSLNEFYDRIGLEPANIGEYMGWHVLNGQIELKFSSRLTENNEPCLVIDFYRPPTADTTRAY